MNDTQPKKRLKRPPRLYFNLRSPFSWMGLRQLEERFPQAPDVIEYYPYWDPDEKTVAALEERDSGFHYTQMSKAKHLYILQDTKRLSARFGYTMAWPIDIDPWWERPHLAWLKARHLGREREFYTAVTAARWERGENICDAEVLRRVAESAGFDGDEMLAAADDPELRAEGVDALAAAYDDDVFGIPYFKVGRHRFWGLDRVDAFLDELIPALEKAAESAPATPQEVPADLLNRVGAYDSDSAGGCG
ncbi:2-hydroxychromene-2-carboxylate isomerase [Streptomyces scopuliridis]|uniref:2-hydroxychromene-2-carboxylate isomerase n=1 Tax=Streptomyces scopuliridis RB72 TaxID=1440053 RepID=A0A2T7T1H2_9ACTN|nr:DsbA family protein [Streptomyces scopuliridis]PVE09005.1 DSBA oxidoreductase [Streptomyces scopuliridis RB72]